MKDEDFVIEAPTQASAGVKGGGRFPVRRIFCIGKNYADHVREMGDDPKESAPVFFTKPADAVVESGAVVRYADATTDLHYEAELVVALKGGGRNISSREAASAAIFGYAAGCDLTRRDLQAAAKKTGGPWDVAKGFDQSAPLGEIVPAAQAEELTSTRLTLSLNEEIRQDAPLSDMIWSIPEILMALSKFFELRPGDLVFTGTPSGIGAVAPGDIVAVKIGALPILTFSIG